MQDESNDNNTPPAAPQAAAAVIPPAPDPIEVLRRELAETREQMSVLIANQMAAMTGPSASTSFDLAAPDAHLQHEKRSQRAVFLRSLFGKGADSREATKLAKSNITAYRKLRDEAKALNVYGR